MTIASAIDKLGRMNAAWDAMMAATLSRDEEAYRRAKADFNNAKGGR